MDTKKVREMKEKLEENILELIKEFEEEADVKVTYISLEGASSLPREFRKVKVDIEI